MSPTLAWAGGCRRSERCSPLLDIPCQSRERERGPTVTWRGGPTEGMEGALPFGRRCLDAAGSWCGDAGGCGTCGGAEKDPIGDTEGLERTPPPIIGTLPPVLGTQPRLWGVRCLRRLHSMGRGRPHRGGRLSFWGGAAHARPPLALRRAARRGAERARVRRRCGQVRAAPAAPGGGAAPAASRDWPGPARLGPLPGRPGPLPPSRTPLLSSPVPAGCSAPPAAMSPCAP